MRGLCESKDRKNSELLGKDVRWGRLEINCVNV